MEGIHFPECLFLIKAGFKKFIKRSKRKVHTDVSARTLQNDKNTQCLLGVFGVKERTNVHFSREERTNVT